jgi:micrococcal nuclease
MGRWGAREMVMKSLLGKRLSQLPRYLQERSRLGAVVLGLLLSLGLWMGLGGPSNPMETAVTVDYAPSGQTLQLLYPLALGDVGSEVERVRLLGITAPDRDQVPWGSAAQDCLNQYVEDETVGLTAPDPTADAYGRLWAYVWSGDRLVNHALLSEGCAYVDVTTLLQHPQPDDWINAQERARVLGLGIWNPDQPLRQSPEAFRQAQGTASSAAPAAP